MELFSSQKSTFNQESFAHNVEKIYYHISRYIKKNWPYISETDRENLVSECVFKIWKFFLSNAQQEKHLYWIEKLSKNHTIDYLRSKKRRKEKHTLIDLKQVAHKNEQNTLAEMLEDEKKAKFHKRLMDFYELLNSQEMVKKFPHGKTTIELVLQQYQKKGYDNISEIYRKIAPQISNRQFNNQTKKLLHLFRQYFRELYMDWEKGT